MASNSVFLVVILVLLASSLFLGYSVDAGRIHGCRPTQGLLLREPSAYCPYGEYFDNCGNMACAKGPGERCGGPSQRLGKCGDGLLCADERCIGCSSIDLRCHEEPVNF